MRFTSRTAGNDAGAFLLGTPFDLETQTPPSDAPSCCCGPRDAGAANWEDQTHWDLVENGVRLLEPVQQPWAQQFRRDLWADLTFREAVQQGLHDADCDPRYTRPSFGPINYFANHFYDPNGGENYMHNGACSPATWAATR